MHTRFSDIILYATGGNKTAFASLMGWSPQYVTKLVKGESIGLQPILAVLERFKEINARWLITGEGKMINDNKMAELSSMLLKANENLSTFAPNELHRIEKLLKILLYAK